MIMLMTQAAIEVATIAILVSAASSLFSKRIVNQDRMQEIKEQINKFQKKYNEAKKRGDKEEIKKLEEEQKQMMGLTKELMINSFKPTMITIVPIIVVISMMNGQYGALGNIIELPIVNWQLSWFWWYFLVAIITGMSVELTYKRWRKHAKEKSVK